MHNHNIGHRLYIVHVQRERERPTAHACSYHVIAAVFRLVVQLNMRMRMRLNLKNKADKRHATRANLQN